MRGQFAKSGQRIIARFLFLFTLLLTGCDGSAHKAPAPSPAIWEVRDDKGRTGWLFGTIHALPDGYDWQTPVVKQALDRSALLVVEVPELNDQIAVRRAFLAAARSPALPPLPDRVETQYRAGVRHLIDKAGMKVKDFNEIESWAAAIMLAGATASGSSANGVDRALLKESKPVIGLESAAAQFSIFDRLSVADQRHLLVQLVRDAANDNERELADAWMRGDMKRLEQEDNTGILASPTLREALLTGRNRAWTAKIAPLINNDRRPFVAVGAAHMAGPEGLPALLAAEGYTVRRLP